MIEVWSKIHQGTIFFTVRADTDHWVALLFKDFPHRPGPPAEPDRQLGAGPELSDRRARRTDERIG
jgi:hypothetical protein